MYAIILQEEKQKEARYERVISESSVAVVHYSKRKNESTLTRAEIKCDYCKRKGHLEAKCYQKHGFPPCFQFTKGKNKYPNDEVQRSYNTGGSRPYATHMMPAEPQKIKHDLSQIDLGD